MITPTEPRAAYINGDDGYLWLTCLACDEPIWQIDAGDRLADLNVRFGAHVCPPAGGTDA